MTTYPARTSHIAKANNSLTWKLAFAQVRRIISVIIKIDFWILLLVAIALVYHGELQGQIAYQQLDSAVLSAEQPSSLYQSDTIHEIRESAHGLFGLEALEKRGYLPVNGQRDIRFEPSPVKDQYPELYSKSYTIFGDRSPLYTVYIPLENGDYLAVITDFSHPLSLLAAAMLVILFIEIGTILSSILKAQRHITRTLRPIYDLTTAAQSMSSTADLAIPLSNAISALDTITENHLDRRISIGDERSELQGLAAAINNMLDRLDASYQAQLRFVSDASHELRTPIAIIQGYASLLERWGKDDPETLEESILAIKSEAEGMTFLVEQLLFLARSDNQSILLEKQNIDISGLMQEVVKETEMIAAKHILASHIDPNLFAHGDPQLLKQGVRILVDNSIKYTPEDGVITLHAKRNNDQILLSVTDTGIGMTEEEVANSFERFWRADEARNRKTGGTGLGLSIAKWIIDSHQGYLEISSRKGLGTRVTIVLPAVFTQADNAITE